MKILLPLDGSKFSESAIPVARSLAERWQAELILVRVADPFVGVGTPAMAVALVEQEKAAAGPYLEEIQLQFPLLQVRGLRPLGVAREAITKVAAEEQCDVIVMASHGRSGLMRWLLGSVAEGVLRHAPCPVLMLRPDLSIPEGGFKNVLLPVDGSDLSSAVVAKLEPYLADDAKITVVRASELGDNEHSVLFDAQARATYLATLEEEIRQVTIPGRNLSYQVLDGQAAHALLELATETQSDLIAMATHGRTGFRRTVLGSVTERVVRHATCAVLACTTEDHKQN